MIYVQKNAGTGCWIYIYIYILYSLRVDHLCIQRLLTPDIQRLDTLFVCALTAGDSNRAYYGYTATLPTSSSSTKAV